MIFKLLDPSQFVSFSSYDALFFTEDGIAVNLQTKIPLMPFREGIKYLEITSAALIDETIVVYGRLKKIALVKIYPVKAFLSETVPSIQNKILQATSWIKWDQRTKYCSRCSNFLDVASDRLEKTCTKCEESFFPNLSPAIMVLVERNNQILLARSPNFKLGVYSAIAGFIDIGETAEMAAYREVEEEVGVKIKNLKYFGSQSWPFPASFMIAFTAEYASGKIDIDPAEIEDARWFNTDNLPEIPPAPSIAYKLITSSV